MNHVYKSIWDESSGTFIAVAENVKSKGKRTSSVRNGVVLAAIGALALNAGSAWADVVIDEGGNSISFKGSSGSITFEQGGSITGLADLTVGGTLSADQLTVGSGADLAAGNMQVATGGQLFNTNQTVADNKTAAESAISAVNTRVDTTNQTVAANKTAADDAFTVVNDRVDTTNQTVAANKTAADNAIAAVDGRVSTNKDNIDTNTGNIATNTQSITDNKNAIDGVLTDLGVNSNQPGSGVKYFRANSTAPDAVASGENSVAIGPNAKSVGDNSLAAGNGAEANEENSMALGNEAIADGTSSIALGDGAKAAKPANGSDPVAAIAIGKDSNSSGTASIAMGQEANASGTNALALGNKAQAGGTDGIALGNGAVAAAQSNISIGTEAGKGTVGNTPNDWQHNIAIGDRSGQGVGGQFNLALGDQAGNSVSGNDNIAFGHKAGSSIKGLDNISIGQDANTGTTADRSISIGQNSKALTEGVAIGFNSSSGDNSLALGNLAKAEAQGVALGRGASAAGDFVALGAGSVARQEDVTGLGRFTNAPFSGHAVSVGSGVAGNEFTRRIVNVAAGSKDTDAVNVGQLQRVADDIVAGTMVDYDKIVGQLEGDWSQQIADSKSKYVSVNDGGIEKGNKDNHGAEAVNSVAIGPNAATKPVAIDSVAIGHDALAEASSAVVLGHDIKGVGVNSTTIGNSKSQALGTSGIAIGTDAVSRDTSSIVIGTEVEADRQANGNSVERSIVIGTYTQSTAVDGIAIGSGTLVNAPRGIAQGSDAFTTAEDAMAFGTGTRASGVASQASGRNAKAYAARGIATGDNARSGETNPNVDDAVNNRDSIAIGTGTVAEKNSSIALGGRSAATANFAQAFGENARATAEESIAQGHNAVASAAQAVAVGSDAKAAATSAAAFGAGATAQNTNSVAIGAGAKAESNRSVALGDGAVTVGATGTSSATLNSLTYGGFAGTAPVATVSVGTETEKRTITNVAAGRITSTSTDAINGSQLFATNTVLGNVANSTKTSIGGETTLGADGTITTNNVGNTGKNNIHEAIIASKTEVTAGTNVAGVDKTTGAGGQDIYTVNAKGTTATAGSGAVTVTGTAGADNITDYAVDLSQQTKDDIINANKGWNVQTNDSAASTTQVKPGETVNFQQGDNIAISQDGLKVTVATADDVKFNTVNVDKTVTIGDATNQTVINKGDITTNDLTVSNTTQLGDTFNVTKGDVKYTGPITDGDHITNKTYVDSGRTVVNAGTNIAGVDAVTDTTTGQTTYTVNADGASVSGSDAVSVTKGTKGADNVTDYALDLSDKTKESLEDADSALQTIVTQVDGKDVKSLTKGDNNANFVSGTNIQLSDDGKGGIEVATNAEVTFDKVTTGDTVMNNDGLIINDDTSNPTAATMVEAGKITVTANPATGPTNEIVIDAETGTLTGLTNTQIGDNALADFAQAGRAATEEQLSAASGSTANIIGGGVTNNNGELTGPFTVNGSDYDNVADAIGQQAKASKTEVVEGKNITVTDEIGADGQTIYTVLTKDVVEFDSVTTGDTVMNNDGLIVNDDTSNPTATTTVEAGKITVAANSATGPTNEIVIDANKGTINGLTNKTWDPENQPIVSGQAATEDQLKSVSDVANTGWDVSANGTAGENVAPGAKVDFSNTDGNILISQTGTDLEFNLDTDLDLTADGSVKTGDSLLNNDGLTVNDSAGGVTNVTTGGVAVKDTNGNVTNVAADGMTVKDAAGNTSTIGSTQIIAGGASPVTVDGGAGTVNGLTNNTFDPDNFTSGQAASEDQLKQVSDVANTGWDVSANGTAGENVAPGAKVDFSNTDGNILISQTGTDLEFNLDTDLDLTADGSVKAGDSLLNNDGLTVNDGAGNVTNVTATGTTVTDGTYTSTVGSTQIVAGGQSPVTIDGSTGTVSGLTNTTWDPENQPIVSGQAATEDQLKSVSDVANTGWDVSANGTAGENVAPGGKVDFSNTDGNILISQTGTDLEFNLDTDLDLTADGSVKAGDTVMNNDGLIVNNPTATTTVEAGKITVAANPTTGSTNEIMLDANKGTLTGLTNKTLDGADFAKAGRAATEEQLQASSTDLTTKGLNFAGNAGDDIHRDLGQTLGIQGGITDATVATSGENVITRTDTDGNVNIELAKDATFDSLTTGDTVMNNEGVKVGDNVFLTNEGLQAGDTFITEAGLSFEGSDVAVTASGINVGGNKITNVAEGTDDTDAVNFGQLNKGLKAAKTEVEGIGNIEVTSKEQTPDGQTLYTVKTMADVEFDSVTSADDAGNETVLNGEGITIAGADDTVQATQLGSTKITVGGGNPIIINGDSGSIVGLTNTDWSSPSFATAGRAATEEQIKPLGDFLGFEGNDYTFTYNGEKHADLASALDSIHWNVEAPEAGDNTVGSNTGGNTGGGSSSSNATSTPISNTNTVGFAGDNNISVSKTERKDASGKVVGADIQVALEKDLKVNSITAIDVNATNVTANEVAIKNGPVINENGIDMRNNKITNLAAGEAPTDAVNVSQLDSVRNDFQGEINRVRDDVNKVDRKLRAGVAAAMASASLPQAYMPGKSMVAMGGGTWGGESGVALGVSKISDNGKWVIKVSGNAGTRGDYGGTVGAGYQW